MSKIEVNTVEPQCGTTLTLGASGDTVQLGTGASQSGFGRTGTVDWDTSNIKTATFTAANGSGYFANTSGGAFNMNLPAGSAGAIVSVVDYTNTFQNNALTLVPNGSEKIGGESMNVDLTTEGQSVTLVYVDSTEGWITVNDSTENVVGNPNLVATGGTITTSGDCKIHTFTGPGTFQVTNVSSTPANNTVSYLVVAGGGSGGADVGGGGGAGGFREYKSPVTPYTASPLDGNPGGTAVTVSLTSYPITVGAGGTAPAPPSQKGNDGNPSVFSTITSTAGGAGGGGPQPPPTKAGNPGGSGGGGGGWNAPPGNPSLGAAGSGNTPPVTPAQGFNGGQVSPGGGCWPGAGGGGATAVGTNSPGSSPLTTYVGGGAGATTHISGSPETYAAGGSGGGDQSTGPNTTTAPANSGGGGGGAGNYPTPNRGNAGGSGIVIIRYKYQ